MKTLIIYGSKHGCTKSCAEKLKAQLKGEVDVIDIKSDITLDLNNYDKVIIGGSIYMGKIQKDINEICIKYLELLRSKKLGLFICCMNENNVETQLKDNFPEQLLASAVAIGYFGGAYNFKEMSFLERFIVRMVSKSLVKDKEDNKELSMKNYASLIEEDNIKKFSEAMNKEESEIKG